MTEKLKIGLALSGGGSRAMAFHLGCLRALNDRNLLAQVKVVSTVSGGSVIGGMFVANRHSFSEFEACVRKHLARGFVQPAIVKALTSLEGLKALCCWILLMPINIIITVISWAVWTLSYLVPTEKRKNWQLPSLHSPFKRFASRTTILQKVFNDEIFKGQRFKDLPQKAPLLIVNATELRTGSAFYFSQKSAGTWRIGDLANQDISLAHAVAASAAFPLLLPALDEVLHFNTKDGAHRKERVILTDGGVYDNLGLAPLWPDRDPKVSLNVTKVDIIICCRAGYGSRFDAPPQFFRADGECFLLHV